MVPDSRTMKVSVLLTATVVLLTMAVDGKGDGGCIRRRRVGEMEAPVPSSCLCHDKCARKGADQAEAGLTDAQSQSCFMDCVLRDGGWVFCANGGGEAAATVAFQPPKLDVVVSKHVRVPVTRPKTEEVMVVEMGFGPDVHQISFLDAWLNMREGEEKMLFRNAVVEPRYAGHYVAIVPGQDKAARKFPIGGNLEATGADGDKTVMVSIAPYVSAGKKGPYWFERQTLFVRAFYIVYEPKEHVGSSINHNQGDGIRSARHALALARGCCRPVWARG
ncbi:hypothetical protein VPH35_025825 [Triticum aestivum]